MNMQQLSIFDVLDLSIEDQLKDLDNGEYVEFHRDNETLFIKRDSYDSLLYKCPGVYGYLLSINSKGHLADFANNVSNWIDGNELW
ncbi:hypothetical protein [Neobacillus mesonae]|uniref:hypothetical protein n=1 Tax=Neobacillus mesonae TaxID=1193713 RepID=UPI00203FD4F5|nr:hypothetical protein [Neobacillus mesonae]MCM3567872.1 hypothetical protein [Neobacillus mesonae]